MGELSHFDQQGHSRMVDVSSKEDTVRLATASGIVRMLPETLRLILDHQLSKGNVCEVARLAGVMAAKQTAQLIPLCHPLPITGVTVDIAPLGIDALQIVATVKVTGKTGVEMEALTAVSVACLTVYDMAKAVDRGMSIERIRLEQKSGGKSGDFARES